MLREKLGPKQSFGGAGLVTGQGWLARINLVPRASSIFYLKEAKKALGTGLSNNNQPF